MLADLIRLHPLATERGRMALLNAAPDEKVRFEFGKLANDEERALWMLVNHPVLFREAEELLFFDYHSQGKVGRHYRTKAHLSVSRSQPDINAFIAGVCDFYRKRDGSGVCCHIEYADRHTEGSLQVSVYVQGLPNDGAEFIEGEFRRRISTPAIEAAIVYDPKAGTTSTVARGGKEVHEALREIFARSLLKIEPQFDRVVRRGFALDALRARRALPVDAAAGLKAARVRKLMLATLDGTGKRLTVEAPSGTPDTSVYDLGDEWFAEGARVFRKFTVIHATIALHFQVRSDAKRAKTINIELTKPNTSNLKNLQEGDRRIAEEHVDRWQLLEPLAPA
jgi:hypothetical protein